MGLPQWLQALTVAACLATVSAGTSAQWADWDYDFDQEKKGWKEIQARIPPYPKTDTLVLLEVGGAIRHRIFIDANSISRGDDGVMRYTSVVKAAGGATNVTFEGMRCETREHKLYALGHDDGTWARARDPQWKHISFSESAPQYGMLFRDYLCPSRYNLPTPRQVVTALRRGEPLNPTAGNRE